MVTALGVTLLVVAMVWTLTLRASVRLAGRGADNGWDNALAYLLATAALLYAARWAGGELGRWWWAAAPVVVGLGQLFALRAIYQVRTLRAGLLAVLHGVFAGTLLTALALVAGAIAAYILYGKIISDPWFLIRLLLRLIGLDHDPVLA
jgi:hypothetical protein